LAHYDIRRYLVLGLVYALVRRERHTRGVFTYTTARVSITNCRSDAMYYTVELFRCEPGLGMQPHE
jgi:hypothetical protein